MINTQASLCGVYCGNIVRTMIFEPLYESYDINNSVTVDDW
jgi:hypothetical protein